MYSSTHTDLPMLMPLNVPQAVSYAPGNHDRILPLFGRDIFGWTCSKTVSYAEPETFLGLMVIIKGVVCSQGCQNLTLPVLYYCCFFNLIYFI